MEFEATRLPDVIIIRPRVFGDERGFFLETWQADAFVRGGITAHFVQDNHSHSIRHVLRGMHYQLQRPQGKLIRVVRGTVFDVVIDIRRESSMFGEWVGVELSAQNRHMLWVPPGFAHGYLAMEDADLLYKCTEYWAPEHERAIFWNDPEVGIRWPLPLGVTPTLSPKDARALSIRSAELP